MTKPPPDKDYISVREVARILMLEQTTVREYLREGKFPNARRPGRNWLVPRGDVDNYLEGRHK